MGRSHQPHSTSSSSARSVVWWRMYGCLALHPGFKHLCMPRLHAPFVVPLRHLSTLYAKHIPCGGSNCRTSSSVTGLHVWGHGSPRSWGLSLRCGPGVAQATSRQKWQKWFATSHLVHNGVRWFSFHGSKGATHSPMHSSQKLPVMSPQSTQARVREMTPFPKASTSSGACAIAKVTQKGGVGCSVGGLEPPLACHGFTAWTLRETLS